MSAIYAKVAFAAVNRWKIKVQRAGKTPAFTGPVNNSCFMSQHYCSARIPRYDCTKVFISLKVWITHKNFSQLSLMDKFPLYLFLTSPNLYQPDKYWRDTIKLKIKSTNFIWFGSVTHCPSAPSILFLWALWIAITPLLKLSVMSTWVPTWSAYLRNFKGKLSGQSVF